MAEPWHVMLSYVALALASGSVGYFFGATANQRKARRAERRAARLRDLDLRDGALTGDTGDSADSDAGSVSEDEGADGDLSTIKPGLLEECKLVLVVRSDLGMSKGKIAAQCSHATLACYKTLAKSNPKLLRHWERTGQAKIAVRCDSEDELLTLQAMAQSLNICARSIQDAGRTQIAAGSRTVLGVGPAPVKLVNMVTGKLKLL